MTYTEFQLLLNMCADTMNERPLGLRHFNGSEPGLETISPNMLLKNGRTTRATDDQVGSEDPKIVGKRLVYVTELHKQWWDKWLTGVFPSLIPFRKWKHECRNLQVGDIVHVKSKGKVPPATYRLGRILATLPDEKGLIRTVTVGFCPRDSRSKVLPYKLKGLYKSDIAIQRIIVILPKEEQAEDFETQ